jgi:hypothetical protein
MKRKRCERLRTGWNHVSRVDEPMVVGTCIMLAN